MWWLQCISTLQVLCCPFYRAENRGTDLGQDHPAQDPPWSQCPRLSSNWWSWGLTPMSLPPECCVLTNEYLPLLLVVHPALQGHTPSLIHPCPIISVWHSRWKEGMGTPFCSPTSTVLPGPNALQYTHESTRMPPMFWMLANIVTAWQAVVKVPPEHQFCLYDFTAILYKYL